MLDECEKRLREHDPSVAVAAASSRSQISKEVMELAKSVEREREERVSGVTAPVKKKDKKKKK